MTPKKFAAYVRWKTRTNDATFTDADMLVSMEFQQEEIIKSILDADEDTFLVPQTDDLVASTITAREYPQPSDILSRMKRVEAKLDGTTWVTLAEIDLTELSNPLSTEDLITSTFNNSQVSKSNSNGARFDIIRKSLMIYSATITATTDGLKIWCNTWPAVVTDLALTTDMSVDPSTTTHGMPRVMHKSWAIAVIVDYKESREKPIPLSERESRNEYYLQKAVKSLRQGNLDRDVTGNLPPASEMGNNGADY